MANRVEFTDMSNDREGIIGPSPSGMLIVQAEVGTFDQAGNISNTDMDHQNDEEWYVEQADADVDPERRIWSAVHNTSSTAGQFNGINNDNRILVFFTATGYIYRVRKNKPAGANTNVAFTWDEGNYKLWL